MTPRSSPPAEPARQPAAPQPRAIPEPSAKGRPSRSPRRLYAAGILLVVVSIGSALVLGYVRRHGRQHEAAARQQQVQEGPVVVVSRVQRSPPERTVVLPADAKPTFATTLYAKTAGFLAELRTDRGQPVRRGQVLAVVRSPENQDAVAAARSTLALQEKTFARIDALARKEYVTRQQRDQAFTDLRNARTALAQAETIAGYQTIRAPFDGVCTARFADPGTLVPAATGSTSAALPVVEISDVSRIRATVYLGQDLVPFVVVGDPVELWEDERPGRLIQAKVTRIAGSLDPRTRTELAEIEFDNTRAGVTPNVYLHARLHVRMAQTPIVPSEAVVIRGGATMVAAVGADHRVKFVPITTGVNDGRQVQVVSGLAGGEDVILNVPSELVDGAAVRVASGTGT